MFLLHVQTIKSSIPFLFQYIFESYFVILVEIGLDRKLPFHSPKSALFLFTRLRHNDLIEYYWMVEL